MVGFSGDEMTLLGSGIRVQSPASNPSRSCRLAWSFTLSASISNSRDLIFLGGWLARKYKPDSRRVAAPLLLVLGGSHKVTGLPQRPAAAQHVREIPSLRTAAGTDGGDAIPRAWTLAIAPGLCLVSIFQFIYVILAAKLTLDCRHDPHAFYERQLAGDTVGWQGAGEKLAGIRLLRALRVGVPTPEGSLSMYADEWTFRKVDSFAEQDCGDVDRRCSSRPPWCRCWSPGSVGCCGTITPVVLGGHRPGRGGLS